MTMTVDAEPVDSPAVLRPGQHAVRPSTPSGEHGTGAPPIRLLGQAVAFSAEMPMRVHCALLMVLVIDGGWVTREWLQTLFWPDATERTAAHNLRANLHRLRRWLAGRNAAHYVQTDSGRLSVQALSDVAVLLAGGAAGAEFATAGTLLPGFVLRDFEEVERWIAARREDLAVLARHVAEAQARQFAAEGNRAEAAQLLAAVLQQDPLAETTLQALLRLAADGGPAALALDCYERFRRRQGHELGLEPLPQTASLAAAVRNGPAAGKEPPAAVATAVATITSLPRARMHDGPSETSEVTWIGRSEVLQRLRKPAPRAAAGCVVAGEAGSGKTRLVREALGDTTAPAEAKAVWLSCRESESLEPLRPLARWLDGRRHELARWPLWTTVAGDLSRLGLGIELPEPAVPSESPSDATNRVLAAAVALLDWLDRPVVVDDLQWADPTTLALVRRLLQRLGSQRQRVYMTVREAELSPVAARWMAAAQADGALEKIALGPWTDFELVQLLRTLGNGQDPPRALIAWLRRRTGGFPLHVLETLRALRSEGLLRMGERGWQGPRRRGKKYADEAADDGADEVSWPLPARVAHLLQRRVSLLDEITQRVLAVAAVAGDAEDVEALAAGAGVGDWATATAIVTAQQAGLLEGRSFAHDLVRADILSRIPAPQRVVLHGVIARRARTLAPARRAEHWWGAGEPVRAVERALEACASERLRGLHRSAAARAERWLKRVEHSGATETRSVEGRLTRPDEPSNAASDDLYARLAVDRALTAFEADDRAETDAWLRRTLQAAPPPHVRSLALVLLAELALHDGRIRVAERLAAEAEACGDGFERLWTLQGSLAHYQGDSKRAAAAFAKLVTQLQRQRPGPALVSALTSLGAAEDRLGPPGAGLPRHEEAWMLAVRLGARQLQVAVALNRIHSLNTLGRFDDAVEVGEQALALGHFDSTGSLMNNVSAALLAAGRIDVARHWCDRLAAHANPSLRCLAQARLLRIDALEGRAEAVAARVPQLLAEMKSTELYLAVAAGIVSLLECGPASCHAAAMSHLRDERLHPSMQQWLDEALARHRSGLASPSAGGVPVGRENMLRAVR